MKGPRHPARNSRACEHCAERPADRLLFTVFMHCGYGDATKKTSYLCEQCTREGIQFLDRIGFAIAYAIDGSDSDALVEMLPEADTDAGSEEQGA